MSASGWEGAIKYSNRIVSEAVGTGNDVLTAFDLGYPAVDEVGVLTDAEGKIEVFIDGVLQDTTLYTLDGDGGTASVGLLTFDTAPAQDEIITASYYAYQTIGYIQSIGITYGNSLEEIYQIGSRAAVELKEGNIKIALSMERAFIDLGLVSVITHLIDATRGWLISEYFDIDIYPAGTTGGYPLLTVNGKFNTYGFKMAQEGIAMDTAAFVGLSITPTTA